MFYHGPGRWTVIDLNPDNQDEGRDALVNIENVWFRNLTLTDAIQSLGSLGFVGTGGFDDLMSESWGPLLDPITRIFPEGLSTWTGSANAERFASGDGADIAYGMGGNDYLETGNDSDILYGGSGDDFLDGGNQADTAYGGTGNDTYLVYDSEDTLIELSGEGYDTVVSATASYTLANTSIEHLFLPEESPYFQPVTGIGNGLANLIEGNALGNVLSGLGGNDVIAGKAGNDTIGGGDGDDMLDGGAGADGMAGGNGHDWLMGMAGDDTLDGGDGDDVLDGGAGVDAMTGGAGSDSYYVDDPGDTAVESPGVGFDTVFATSDFTLGAELEFLTLLGGADIDGAGNVLDNRITGNAGRNILSGRGGADWLLGLEGDDLLNGGGGSDEMGGGAGNDIYIVDNKFDIVVEGAGGDIDLVKSSVSHELATNVENLLLTGIVDINGTGNGSANRLTGNGGANRLFGMGGADQLEGGGGNDRLDGGTGIDRMLGGSGNDVYVVDHYLDRVFETATFAATDTADAGGTDTIYSYASFRLDNFNGVKFVENLTLLDQPTGEVTIILPGMNDLAGTGNDLANAINGNSGNNLLKGLGGDDRMFGGDGDDRLYGQAGLDVLNGGKGADRLEGGAARDILRGGADADSFVFDDGDIADDRIVDFTHTQGDRINLAAADANTANGSGDDPFSFIGTAAFHAVAGELRYELVGTTTLVKGDLDGDGGADFTIRLDGVLTLVAGDFVL